MSIMASTSATLLADKNPISLDTDKILRLRQKLKLTQEECARRAGLSGRQRWNDIEHGIKTNVKIETLERIASALGVKAKDLLK